MSRSLGARAISGFRWSALAAAANIGFQLGFAAIMARLLSPADFGLMAMAMVVLRLFSYFSQLGLGAALVQREQIGPDDVRCALGLTWLVCLAIVAAIVAGAPLAGRFFQNDEVVPILRVLSLNMLLVGLGAISMSILRRELRFGAIAAVEGASYVVGFGLVGVAAAWAGAGVWSLVLTTFTQSAITLVGAWLLTRHPLRPSLRGDRAALLGYGARYSVIGFLEAVASTLDGMLVGRLLGEAKLGVYNRAATITYQPVGHAGGIMVRVLFPILSAAQRDARKTGGVLLLGLSAIGIFGAAVCLGASAAAGDVVRVLLGARWMDAAPVLAVLALATPLLLMAQVCSVVCDALAFLRFKLVTQCLHLSSLAVLILALSGDGLRGIAWAVVGAEVLRSVLYVTFLTRRLACSASDVGRVLAGVALSGALAYLFCSLTAAWAAGAALPPVVALGLDMLAGLAALALGALAGLRLLEGTETARFADASVPGWQRLRTKLGLASARA